MPDTEGPYQVQVLPRGGTWQAAVDHNDQPIITPTITSALLSAQGYARRHHVRTRVAHPDGSGMLSAKFEFTRLGEKAAGRML